MRGKSQEKLAEKAGISSGYLSIIEAPNMPNDFTMEAFYNIADALEVDPAELLRASVLPDSILNSKKVRNVNSMGRNFLKKVPPQTPPQKLSDK